MFLSQTAHLFSEATALLQDRKFDTALRRTTITSFVDRKNVEHHWSDDLIWNHHPDADTYRQDTTLLPQLIESLLSEFCNLYRGRLSTWQEMWNIIETNISIQHTWITKTVDNSIKSTKSLIRDLLGKFDNHHYISRLTSVLDNLNEVINKLPEINSYIKGNLDNAELLKIKSGQNQMESKDLGMKFTWSTKMIVIEWNREKWLLPKAYILQMHNKIADIISVLVYALGSSGVHHPDNFYLVVLDFIKLLCNLHISKPNLFFEFAKALEGICIGTLLYKSEDWVNSNLLNTLIEELNELFVEDMRHHPLVKTILNEPLDVIVELSCLSKITGHPFVEIKEGVAKLYKRVNQPFDVSVDAVSFCISTFKENFIRNYILKFSRWPNVDIDMSSAHPALIYSYPRGIDPYSKEIVHKFGRITWEHWAAVDLLPEMRFNYCENIIPLLKDKALCVLRSQVFNAYIKKNVNDLRDTSSLKRLKFQDTRVLLHYLFTSELDTDHKDYLMKFCASPEDLHDMLDYLVIRLVPKEKELKTLPRFFGCKTFLDRARTIVGEQNVATYLNLFCDEQGMTLSELSLIKKLYSMQNLSKLYKTHKVFKISLDAEAWNTKQRNETNKAFASQTLDRLFDTNLYSKTHDAYLKSLMVVPDEEDFHWWEGQPGGIEGLNQNQWVLLYTAQMRYSFKDTAFPFHQLIHGDDYRAAVAVPYTSIPPGEEKEVVEDLMKKVSDAAKAFGHNIKLTESYASEHVLCYSKIVFYKGIQLPSACRKIQKTYGATNAFLPILDDYIGSSFSNAHSACYTTTNHYAPYLVALFWTSYYFKNSPYYKKCTTNEIIALTLTPSVVGGPPIIYLHNMFVRGESDLLSSFIDLCQFCSRYYPHIGNIMKTFLAVPFSQTKPYSLLLKDPYSLPISKPISISLFLKRIVKRRLIRTVRNNHVRDLLQTYNDDALKILIEDLITASEWQAKPFTALYSNSPHHLLDELLAGFVSAKSIKDLLITSSRNVAQSQRILKKAIAKDAKFHSWRISVMRREIQLTNYELDLTACPAMLANDLREYAWGLYITTVTHPPPQHQVSFTTQKIGAYDKWALDNHFVMNLHPPTFVLESNRWHYADGGKIPFVGHTTAAGVITPTIRVSEKDPVASKVSNLLTLRSWMNKSVLVGEEIVQSEFPRYVDKMIACYTEVPATELQKFAPAWKSGSITHRLRAHGFRDTVVPNNLMNLYTLMSGETNTHRHFRETRDDYTVNYLHIFCYATNVCLLDLEFQSFHEGPCQTWVVTTPCEYCNTPIVEPPVVFEKQRFLLSKQPRLQMTHLGDAATELIRLAQQEYDIAFPTLDTYGEDEIPIEIARMIVVYECLKKAWDERVTLSKRYGVHDMTGQGLGLLTGLAALKTEKTLGETELRALPLKDVVDVLATYILYFFLRETPNPYKTNINARFNTIIPSHLPWYTLIEWYYKAGLLRQLIRYIFTLSDLPPHEGCYYNVNTATIYIGKVLTQYALETPPLFPYIPGAIRDTTETMYRRYVYFYTRCLFAHHKTYHGECRNIYKKRPYHTLSHDEKQHILEGYITYSRNPKSFEKFIEDGVFDRGQFLIDIQDGETYTEEEFAKWNLTPPSGIIKHYYYHHNHLVNDVLSDITDEEIEAINNEERGVILEKYTITKYPIGACIDIVRTHKHIADKSLGNDYLDPEHEEHDLHLLPIQNRPQSIVNFPALDNICVTTPRNIRNFEKVPGRMHNYPWSNVTRVLGSSISSCNKFHMILQDLDMQTQKETSGWITCCAEGEGGVLNHLLHYFPNSLGIFNTLIDDLRSGASAGICDKDPTTSNRYFSEPLNQGVSDLLLPSTIDAYLNAYPYKSFIFTCDADMRNMTEREVILLWSNVTEWWLRSRTRNSLFILKVFSDYIHPLGVILTKLCYYSLYVRLHKVPNSHLNTEFYITAQGTSREFRQYDIPSIGIHPNIHATLVNFITPIHITYARRRHEYDEAYGVFQIRNLLRFLPDFDIRQGLIFYVISQKLRLPLTFVCKSISSSEEDIIKNLTEEIKKENKDLLRRLNSVENELRHSFLASDTLRHRVQLIDRLIFLHGSQALLTTNLYNQICDINPINDRPEDIIQRITDRILILGGVHLDPDVPRSLKIGAYRLDLESILYKSFGATLQLLGCLLCRQYVRGKMGLIQYADEEEPDLEEWME